MSRLLAATNEACSREEAIQPFAPDIAVEIAGEYEPFQDLLANAKLYLRCGTLEVWLISIKSREVVQLTHERREVMEDNEGVRTSLLPDFAFRLRDYLR